MAGKVDLDASLVTLGVDHKTLEKVFYATKSTADSSIVHRGDNRSGNGTGDDEVIDIKLSQVGANVDTLGICITSYTESKFTSVRDAYVRVFADGREIVRYSLQHLGPYTAYVLAFITRGLPHDPSALGWTLTPASIPGYGKSVSYTLPAMSAWVKARRSLGGGHARHATSQEERTVYAAFQTPRGTEKENGTKR